MKDNLLDVVNQPDIMVIGGGAAGVGAAVGASSKGASTILIELNEYLGGRATASQVGTVCGLYYTGKYKSATYVCKGFPKAFAEKLSVYSNSKPLSGKRGVFFLPYEIEAFNKTCLDFLKYSQLRLFFNSKVKSFEVHNNTIRSVTVSINNKRVHYKPKCIIDTSGSVLTTHNSGINTISDEHYQASARVFKVGNINIDNESTLELVLMRCLRKGIENNFIPVFNKILSVVPGSLKNGSVLLKLGIPDFENKKGHTLTDIDKFSTEAINQLFSYLTKNTEVFSDSNIISIAAETGSRTGASI